MINKLYKKINVILLGFDSGKNTESHSKFNDVDNCYEYQVDSFEEQSCLIHFAKECVFFTEGDFRSHTYIPPLLGKDVYVIASEKVLSFDQTSCEFWIENIFNFGGNMFTLSYEELLKNGNLEELLND